MVYWLRKTSKEWKTFSKMINLVCSKKVLDPIKHFNQRFSVRLKVASATKVFLCHKVALDV